MAKNEEPVPITLEQFLTYMRVKLTMLEGYLLGVRKRKGKAFLNNVVVEGRSLMKRLESSVNPSSTTPKEKQS